MALTSDEIRNIAQTLRYADLFQVEDNSSLTKEQLLFRQLELVYQFRQMVMNTSHAHIPSDVRDAFREFLCDANIYTQFIRTYQNVLTYIPINSIDGYWETLTPNVQRLLIKRLLSDTIDKHLKQDRGRTQIMKASYEDLKLHFLIICSDAAFLEDKEYWAFEVVFNTFYSHAKQHLRQVLFAFEEYKHHYFNFIHNWLQKCEAILTLELQLTEVHTTYSCHGYFLRNSKEIVLRKLKEINDYVNQAEEPIRKINGCTNCVMNEKSIIGLIDEFKNKFGISSDCVPNHQNKVKCK